MAACLNLRISRCSSDTAKHCGGENYIVLEADLALHVSSKEEVLAKMAELSAQRRLKQPLEYPERRKYV